MRDCRLASLGALVIVLAVGSVTSVSVAGQTRAADAKAKTPAASKTWTAPLTADGQPDLEGVWLNNSATPLERPRVLEGRSFLTDEEVAELKKRADRLFKDGDADFAGGDAFFLAALANPDHYRNPNATGGSEAMIDREFDNRTSLIVNPPDGKIPWTPNGRLRQDAAVSAGLAAAPGGPEDLTNVMRCTTYGVPRLGAGNVGGAGPLGYYQIVQAPGYVVLIMEAIHEARIIPLDGRPHLPQRIRQWSGDSRGRWEGNTLVVDTTNFSPQSSVLGSTENLHLVERFTRTAPHRIDYEITLNDPATWTKPWTVVIRLKESPYLIYEYACHEGNYEVMRGILAGSRAREIR